MAQSRERRKQRAKRRPPPRTGPSQLEQKRTKRTRAVIVAFLLILGLAGVFALSPGSDPNGAPLPISPTASPKTAR